MNRKGFLRIIEASISILIIAGVLFVFFNQQKVQNSPDLSELARDILEEVSKNTALRNAVLNNDPNGIVNDFISGKVPGYLSFEMNICEVDASCGTRDYKGNVYSAERIISSTIEQPVFSPKKIRLFLWEK